MQQNSEHYIWCEKHRPSTLDGYIGNEHFVTKLRGWLNEGDVPHLLLYGPAGTGKTTAAKIIVNNINCDYLFINASDENNVDTVRNKLKGFAAGIGFKDLKIAVLDECLDKDTEVWVLRDGIEQTIAIKEVNDKTDLVKSWNVKQCRVEWRPFILLDRGIQDLYEIELVNGEIVVCTDSHKWYVEKNGIIKVVNTSELHKYQHILSP